MVIVDTSIWVDFFKNGNEALVDLLNSGLVVTHEFVIEELILGGMKNREEHYHLLCLLKCYQKVSHIEVIDFIHNNIASRYSIGLVDSYLLSTALIDGLKIYSADKNLVKAAKKLDVCHSV